MSVLRRMHSQLCLTFSAAQCSVTAAKCDIDSEEDPSRALADTTLVAMELSQYFGSLFRKAMIVVTMAAAGVITGLVVSSQPSTYEASVRLLVPGDQTGSVGVSSLYIANFKEAARSESILQDAARRNSISESAIADALKVSQVGQSSQLQVSFENEDARIAEGVASAVARSAAVALAQQRVDQAASSLEAARGQYENAFGELTAFQAQNDNVEAQPRYDAQRAAVDALRAQLAQAELRNNQTLANSLRNQIEAKSTDLAALRDLARQESALQDSIDAAQSVRNEARKDLVSAQAIATRAQSDSLVSGRGTEQISTSRVAIQAAILAAVAAFALILGLFMLLDGMKKRRATKRAAKAASIGTAGTTVSSTVDGLTSAEEVDDRDAGADVRTANEGEVDEDGLNGGDRVVDVNASAAEATRS